MLGTTSNPHRLAAAIVLAAGVTLACSVERHYETLSIFFDGVPTPEQIQAKREAEARLASGDFGDPSQMTSAERAAALSTQVVAVEHSTHKPVEDKRCTDCHDMKEGDAASMSGWLSDFPELVVPKEDLCVRCHDRPVGTYVHGPAGSGQCAICHQAHTSLNPHLLRNANQEILCRACHLGGTFMTEVDHEDYQGQDCVECHNPHTSERKYLLRDPPAEAE